MVTGTRDLQCLKDLITVPTNLSVAFGNLAPPCGCVGFRAENLPGLLSTAKLLIWFVLAQFYHYHR